MPLWGKNDAASNSTIYAPAQLKKAPNTNNRDLLFGNTTSNAYFDGVTVGQYAVDDNEIAAGSGRTAHTGWVLRTTGQGGRSGRIFDEVLVAGGITGDAEDTSFPDYTLTITTNPAANSGSVSGNISRTFTAAATSVPSGASISYLWYKSTDNVTYTTTVGNTAFSGQTSATLTANIATLGVNTWVKAVASATGAASVNTAVAKFTATA
jgi:hypothetical protein